MPKLGPAGMMSETAIRGMLNGIKKQLNSGKLPAPLLSKVLDHKQSGGSASRARQGAYQSRHGRAEAGR